MQAAANRLAGPLRSRRTAAPDAQPRPASIEDAALLGALPIAAAVVGLTSRGILKLIDRNPRFDEVIALAQVDDDAVLPVFDRLLGDGSPGTVRD